MKALSASNPLYLSIALLFFCLLAQPALAHRPYAIEQSRITAPDGSILIIEKLYGDGIFGPDPVSLQIRNTNGAVLAHTKAGNAVTYFCPSLNFCWVFPYSELFPLSAGMRLNPELLDIDAPDPDYDFSDEEADQFAAYLKGDSSRVVSEAFDYPEYENKDHSSHFKLAPLSLVFSPLLIIVDNLYWLAIIFGLRALLVYRYATTPKSRLNSYVWTAFWLLFITGILVSMAFILVFAAYYLGEQLGKKLAAR